MFRLKDHPAIFDQVICLSEKEQHAPLEVIKDFFADYRLNELRDIQDQIQKVCLTSSEESFSQPERRSELLLYNVKLIRLLEAASRLRELVAPPVGEPNIDLQQKQPFPVRSLDIRISDFLNGLHDIAIDVAQICLVVVNAWTAKVCTDLKLSPPKTQKPTPRLPLDLDNLQSRALELQSKLTKLSGLAVDILIREIYQTNMNI